MKTQKAKVTTEENYKDTGFTLEYILWMVDAFDFQYCQLQTGLNKFELTDLLEENDFVQCDDCLDWKKYNEFEPINGSSLDVCKKCFKSSYKYYY